MTTSALRSLANPIRLGGLLGVFFLVGPGSLEGLSLLLLHAWGQPVAPLVAPHVHAALQLVGFFLLVIWGFLTHALPGILGADSTRTERIRRPMVAVAFSLLALWFAEAFNAPMALRHAAWGAVAAGILWGTGLIVSVVRDARRSWRDRPNPVLVVPLVVFAAAWGLMWARSAGLPVGNAGSELLLLGVVMPVILAMSFRMFPALVGLELPRQRWFDVGVALWAAAVLCRVAGAWIVPARAVGAVLLLAAGIVLVVALRVFEPPRTATLMDGPRRVLRAHAVVAWCFHLAGGAILVVSAAGWMPGREFHLEDLGRHAFAIGYALITVMGILQRTFPNFLRGAPSSLRWTVTNLALVAGGLLLRGAEPFLPATAPWVRLSAWLVYAGIMAFGVHLLRSMLRPASEAPPVNLVAIRVSRGGP